jgi:acetylornithine/succinyldiaminopimelate/putrescine aminotransferase
LRFVTFFSFNRRSFDMNIATHPFDALMDITARPPVVFVRGEGSFLWDDTSKLYLDFMQGWAVNCLGHSPPVVVEALAAQARLLLTPSPRFTTYPASSSPRPWSITVVSTGCSSPIRARKPMRAL